MQSVLDRLPARYGDVLEWKYIEGRSVEEIGELLGIGQIAAQSVLARARVAFREALETVFGSTAQDVLAACEESKPMTSGIDKRGPQETGPHATPADEAGIEELLRQVGARDEPAADMMREVEAAVHAEWQNMLQERRRRRAT